MNKTIRKLIATVLGVGFGAAIGFLSISYRYNWTLPPHDYPIFFSPILSSIVAVSVFVSFMADEDAHKGASIPWLMVTCVTGLLWTVIVCFFLTFFDSWLQHLILLFLLFLGFLIWDFVMLSLVKSESHREEITIGNRLVNRPTMIAVIFISAFLLTVNLESLRHVENKPGYHCAQDAFVAGLISYHLIVSSCGYFGSSLGLLSGNWLLTRWFFYLFFWVPTPPSTPPPSTPDPQNPTAEDAAS